MTEGREHNEQPKPQEAKPRTDDNQANEKDGAPPAQSTPWAFYVVIGAFLCVTVVFLVVWLFPTPKNIHQKQPSHSRSKYDVWDHRDSGRHLLRHQDDRRRTGHRGEG
jgi:hypothetical protein